MSLVFIKGGEHIKESRIGEIRRNNFGTLMKIVGWRIAEEKEFTIKKVANEYKNIIPLKLYESLIRYQVLIENDPYYIIA